MSALGSLPPETVEFVLSELDQIVAEIVRAVDEASPVYGELLASPEGIGLRLGVEQAIRAFLEAIGRGERPGNETDELWRRLGEAEFQAGRGLEELRLAFRAGTRAAWRAAAEVAVRADIDAATAVALAEAIFLYGDDLATDVVEGYLRMQSDEAGERERRRRRLATALLDPDGHDAETVARAAELAGWPLPRELAVVAFAPDAPTPSPQRLDASVLIGSDGDGPWLIVPDPDGPGRRHALQQALDQSPAAIGLTVEPARARDSLRWARLTLHQIAPAAPDGAPVRTEDHLSTVILLQDPALAAVLTAHRLGPLNALPVAERERLADTLAAWLDHQRHTPDIAEQLHVHPQTVRYRIARLRELLGDAMDTPHGRFELQIALRAERTLTPLSARRPAAG